MQIIATTIPKETEIIPHINPALAILDGGKPASAVFFIDKRERIMPTILEARPIYIDENTSPQIPHTIPAMARDLPGSLGPCGN